MAGGGARAISGREISIASVVKWPKVQRCVCASACVCVCVRLCM